MFEENDVVVWGWTHRPENSVIPQLLSNEMQNLVARDFTVILEHSPEQPDWSTRLTDPFIWPSYRSFQRETTRLGFQVLGGDMTGKEYANAWKAAQVPENGSLAERLEALIIQVSEARDHVFLKSIMSALKDRPKVLVLIGGAHLDHLLELLLNEGIRSAGIRTRMNSGTLAVSYESETIGVGTKYPEMSGLWSSLKTFTVRLGSKCSSTK